MLSERRLAPDLLVLEITENIIMSDRERARQILDDIRRIGVQVAVDDFGTGYSSLAYLRDLPIDELKVDRSFISTSAHDRRSGMIVESTIKMAHALDLRVVAEGVEDPATAAMLVAAGVDVLQGYHIARPMPADRVIPWVNQWRAGLDKVAS
jgi:EAL domain-containing protein (putative c-di-GMP-specific phosphodiesterase class I)